MIDARETKGDEIESNVEYRRSFSYNDGFAFGHLGVLIWDNVDTQKSSLIFLIADNSVLPHQSIQQSAVVVDPQCTACKIIWNAACIAELL